MTRVTDEQSVRVRPWKADMGAVIGEKYLELGDIDESEVWFRHALNIAPFNYRATKGLVSILLKTGHEQAAVLLCNEFVQRIGEDPCNPI